jgi:hypothetical protein
VVAAVVILLAVVALAPDLMKPIYERLDALIFKKSETTSFDDRTRCTNTPLNAFFATDGLGVGFGSVMTSNWFVAILSSTGIFGAVLLFIFILRLYILRCRNRNADPRTMVIAGQSGTHPANRQTGDAYQYIMCSGMSWTPQNSPRTEHQLPLLGLG